MTVRAIENFDHCLHFQVLDKRISCIDDGAPEVVADNYGNICIKIEFDDQWDGCSKVARFIYNGEWKDVLLDSDNECICPSEVVKKGRFSLGVYGENLKTTTPITITVVPSILSDCDGELPDAPTDDVYLQILKMTADANAAVDEAAKAAWEAAEATEAAIEALTKAQQDIIVRGGLGKGTVEGGEVFNDYSYNAAGSFAHAENQMTQALGENSHASGYQTITRYKNQFVCGQRNENKEDTLFEIGNGALEDYGNSNAFEVYKDGHAEVQTMGESDNSVATRKFVRDMVGSGGTGGGLNITDDGNGNVTITPVGNTSITDDGQGNVTIL